MGNSVTAHAPIIYRLNSPSPSPPTLCSRLLLSAPEHHQTPFVCSRLNATLVVGPDQVRQ